MNWKRENEDKLYRQIGYVFKDIEEPLIERWVMYQLTWYNKKANQYRFFSRAQTALSLVSPILTSLGVTYGEIEWVKPIIIVLGGILTILIGLLCSMRCAEQWIRYRSVCENLKGLTIDYLYKCKGKSDDELLESSLGFLDEIRKIIGKELEEWSKLQLDELQKRVEDEQSTNAKSSNP